MDMQRRSLVQRNRRCTLRHAVLGSVTVLAMVASVRGAVAATSTDLLIRATVKSFIVGSPGRYAVVGANDTNATFTVTDPLPSTLQFVSATGVGWTCATSGQTVTCDNATPLARGAASSIALTVHITAAVYPSVTNVATLTYPADANLGNNTGRRPTTIRQ